MTKGGVFVLDRQGGSFADGSYYSWQNWMHLNKPWLRKPAVWGRSVISGW